MATYGHLAVALGKFLSFSNGGRNTDRPADQNLVTFGDTLSWTLGRHNIKIGGDFVRNQAVDGFAVNRGNVRGLVTYSGTGASALSRFLQGQAGDSVSYVNLPRPAMDVSNWESGYFAQDDFRVTSRLTLNLGMRYDLVTPFIDKNDLMVNLDPNYRNTTTGQIGRFVIPSTKTLPYLDPNVANFGYVIASESGLGIGRGLVQTYRNGFGPRVGLAFQVTPKTVLRGGYGLYYPTSAAQGIRDPLATNTFNQARTKRQVSATDPVGSTPLSGWPSGGETTGTSPFSGGVVKGFGNTPSANYVPVDLKNPRIQQWNATVERELPWQSSLRFSYIGSQQSGQIVGRDLNMIPPSDNPFGTTTGDGITPCDPTATLTKTPPAPIRQLTRLVSRSRPSATTLPALVTLAIALPPRSRHRPSVRPTVSPSAWPTPSSTRIRRVSTPETPASVAVPITPSTQTATTVRIPSPLVSVCGLWHLRPAFRTREVLPFLFVEVDGCSGRRLAGLHELVLQDRCGLHPVLRLRRLRSGYSGQRCFRRA